MPSPMTGENPGSSSVDAISHPFSNREESAERELDLIANSSEMHQERLDAREEGRTEKELLKREVSFEQLNALVQNSELFKKKSLESNLERNYRGGRLGELDRYFAGADVKGEYTFKEEAIRKGKKVLGKTAVTAGLTLLTAGILGGLTVASATPLAVGIGAGFLGRGAYELYRVVKGSERAKRNDITAATEAISEGSQILYDKLGSFIENIQGTRPELASSEITEMPEYKEMLSAIVDFMYDKSKQKVRRLEDGKFEAVLPDEITEEEGVTSISEMEKELRDEEKKQERISDLISFVTSVGASSVWKVLYGASSAARVGQNAANEAGKQLSQGDKIGPYNFDTNPLLHKVHAIADGAKAHLDRLTGVWNDTLANLKGAIASKEAIAAGVDQLKSVVATGIGSLEVFFAGAGSDIATESKAKSFDKQSEKKIGTIRQNLGLSRESSAPPTEGLNSVENITNETKLNVGEVVQVLDSDLLLKKGFPNYHLFQIISYEQKNGKEYAVLTPIDHKDMKPVLNAGVLYLNSKKFEFPLGGIKHIGSIATKPSNEEASTTEKNQDSSPETSVTATTELKTDDVEEKSEQNEIATILERLEKDRKLPDDKIAKFQQAANWVLSRLTKEQIESLNITKKPAKEMSEEEIFEDKALSDKRFRELAKIVLKNELVTHYAGVSNGDKRRYPDLDGRCAIGLFRMAGIEVDDKNPDMFVAPGGSIPGKVMVDTINREGIGSEYDPSEGNYSTTGWADHHDPSSGRDSSGTKLLYEVFTGLGMIDEVKYPYLNNMVEFVTNIDNAAYAGDKEAFENSYKTMIGLARYIKFDKLEMFFKDGKDPSQELTEEDLHTYGLKVEQKDKNGIVDASHSIDRSAEHKKKIDSSLKEIEEMEKSGLVVDTGDPDKFGKVLVDIDKKVQMGYEAARYRDCDTYILWNPETDSFFISSKNKFPDGFTLSQGIQVRENMWIKGFNTEGELELKLKNILDKMAGVDNIKPEGKLAEEYEKEKVWDDLEKQGKRPEDDEKAKLYWKWVESKGKRVAKYHEEKMRESIEIAAKKGTIEEILKRKNKSIEEFDKQRFSAFRLLAIEMGYKIGAFSVNIKEGKVGASISKLEAEKPVVIVTKSEDYFKELEALSLDEAIKKVGFENLDLNDDAQYSALEQYKDALIKFSHTKNEQSDQDDFKQTVNSIGIKYVGDRKIPIVDVLKSIDILLDKAKKEPIVNGDRLEEGETFIDDITLNIGGKETKIEKGSVRESLNTYFKYVINNISRTKNGKIGIWMDMINTSNGTKKSFDRDVMSLEEWQELFDGTKESTL